jgi:hypothetical protein
MLDIILKLLTIFKNTFSLSQDPIWKRFKERRMVKKRHRMVQFVDSVNDLDFDKIAIKLFEAKSSCRIRQLCCGILFLAISAIVFYGFLIHGREPKLNIGAAQYNDAGAFSDLKNMLDNTNFGRMLDNTNENYCIYTQSGSVLDEYKQSLEDAVKRGVHVRVLIQDPGNRMGETYNIFSESETGSPNSKRSDAEDTVKLIESIQLKVIGDSSYKGSIHIKYSVFPVSYSIWIRDYGFDNVIANLHPIYAAADVRAPIFRVDKNAVEVVDSLMHDFNTLWNDRKKVFDNHSIPNP